mmetsp:Transcript_15215/g.39554  ORF Transcript_15215/g.39554 Transcript_15215/m.39554 type:complete len:109 (-) Transcript_15215:467-793(-)
MPKAAQPKSKEAKAKAATSGGKGKKKKWSKGKVKEKLQNLVLFDKSTYEKLISDIPKNKLITPSIISEKLKVNGSLARRAVKELLSKGLIRVIDAHHAQAIYTRSSHG